MTKKYTQNLTYGTAILSAFEYLMEKYPEVFIIGQGLWSPWYVGSSMTDLDKKFGIDRVIDTPVSESACTGAAVGASLAGMRPVVVQPRMDFMLYAMDSIVNEAANWSHMFGGQASPAVTIRGIINRGGEQGAQHSQALHAWFSHVPGLRVVMPSSVADARDLLISSVLSDDPVIYIDDRWLYDQEDQLGPIEENDLSNQKAKITRMGSDITLVGVGYGVFLANKASKTLFKNENISAEVLDVRVLNPFDVQPLIESLEKTKRLVVIDPGWKNCGFSAEIITSVLENISPNSLLNSPSRITLPNAPAPTSRVLEKEYYFTDNTIVETVKRLMHQ